MLRASACAAALIVSSLAIWACTVPTTSKAELKVCKAGEDGCPAERPRNTNPKNPTTPGPGTETPVEAPGRTETDAGGDAGSDSAALPPFGPMCLKLKVCCEAFVENGVFSDFCYESLETRKESICYTKHQAYVTDPENQFCPN
jgi:hypothetical protein